MLESMHGDVEPPPPQLVEEIQGYFPVPLWYKIEAGAESKFFLQFGQFKDVVAALARVHVVRQHQGKLLALRPARPPRGFLTGLWVDRSYVGEPIALVLCDLPPWCNLHRPRNQRL